MHLLLQTGWLVTISAVQHVWRKVIEEHKFKFLETRNLNQDALENSFGAIRLHCSSNTNPSLGGPSPLCIQLQVINK